MYVCFQTNKLNLCLNSNKCKFKNLDKRTYSAEWMYINYSGQIKYFLFEFEKN